MLNREKMLSHLKSEDDKMIAAHTLDKAESVLRGADLAYTNFLDPHQQEVVEGIIRQIPEVKYRFVGGYDRAERKRLLLIPEYMLWEMIEEPLAFLEIEGNFSFQQVSHRDYLGSLLALGLRREMLGDILVLKDGGCHLIAALEVKDTICLNLTRVHQVPVKVREIEKEELKLPEERIKEISTTVASLRLDSVASAGFSTSRSKMAKEIKNEKVKVNFQIETNPARMIKPDDVISIRGRGRVEIKEIEGETRKGRIKLTLQRYY
ncbi:photosystem II S4 domain protein [Anoxybacter fermentans]|uniref:Photosystem II S4 domain protein n=1 Tax=Anoxybacter fermentans TaxID=1323375 RepID=A0A3S9SXP0_9FIRM|nr:YlmH/Sll1252 family protein [Anoxybacter fermentans]AZR73020.1 photosystem II S4 domain protein [Anoxybacter fermentans]